MNFEEWLYQRCASPGRGWRYRLYRIVADANQWWFYTSSFERWTVWVAAILIALLAGLVLARIIGG